MGHPTARAEPLLTRAFGLLVTAHFVQAVGWSSMVLFPLYLADLGASRSEIGSIMGVAAVGGLSVRPLVGWGLDRWGRKPTLAVGTIISGVAMMCIAWVDEIGPVVYCVRLTFGIGTAALFTGYFTFCTDLVPASRRTEGIALFGISGLVPLLVNPAAERFGVHGQEVAWFLPILGVVMMTSLLALWPIKEPVSHESHKPPGAAEVLRALRQRNLWPVWLATCIFAALVMLFFSFATVVAKSRGVQWPATYWLTYAAGSVSVRLFGARIPDLIGTRNMVGPSLAMCVIGAVALAGVHDLETLAWAGLLGGIGHGYAFPVLTSQVAERAPEAVRGSALAMFTALWDVAHLLVPPLFGLLSDRCGDWFMFRTAALCSALAMFVWVAAEHRLGAPTTDATEP